MQPAGAFEQSQELDGLFICCSSGAHRSRWNCRNPIFANTLRRQGHNFVWSSVMTRTLTALAAAGAIALAAVASPTTAEARWGGGGWHGGGFGGWHGGGWRGGGWGWGHRGFGWGGLAAGALIGSALAAPYWSGAYAYDPYYSGYGYGCTIRHQRVWNGWRWIIRRVEVC